MLSMQDIKHERMKVYPGRTVLTRLEPWWEGGVEKVHEHRLACTYGTVEVESFWDFVQGYYWSWGGGVSREEFTELWVDHFELEPNVLSFELILTKEGVNVNALDSEGSAPGS